MQDNYKESAKPVHLDKQQITSGTTTDGSIYNSQLITGYISWFHEWKWSINKVKLMILNNVLLGLLLLVFFWNISAEFIF